MLIGFPSAPGCLGGSSCEVCCSLPEIGKVTTPFPFRSGLCLGDPGLSPAKVKLLTMLCRGLHLETIGKLQLEQMAGAPEL